MAVRKGLQKFTDSAKKLNILLRRKRITEADIDQLSEPEKVQFNKMLNEILQKAKGSGRDLFYQKIESILSDQTKNDFWEYNHSRIMLIIETLLQEYKRMPTRSEIAQKADLSRTTVYKHLKEYTTHPLYMEQLQKMRILSTNVISKVYQSAMAGDIGSQKLYFNVMGFLNNGQGLQIQTMNNFIQINNTILSQETIRHLNREQLLNIESILKSIIPQSEITTVDAIEKSRQLQLVTK
jgi:DNA-binding transcriptional ArsR family regulator